MGATGSVVRENVLKVPESWLGRMPCINEDPAKFDPESPVGTLEEGEEICMGVCTLATQCRELAAAKGEHGLWGGVIVTRARTYSIPEWMRQRSGNPAASNKTDVRHCKRQACRVEFEVTGTHWGQQYHAEECRKAARRERESAMRRSAIGTLAAAS